MRVLYVCHTALVGGAERSLLDQIMTFGDRVDPVLACPNGALSQRAAPPASRRCGSIR